MNTVLIVVIIVLALLGLKGALKGLFKILFSIISLIACILLAGFLTTPIVNTLSENTEIYSGVDGFVYNFVKDNKNINREIESTYELAGVDSNMTIPNEYVPVLQSSSPLIAQRVNTSIDGMLLPSVVKNNLKVSAEDVSKNIKSGVTVKEAMLHTISYKLSRIVSIVITFIILFIIFEIIFWIIYRILNIFSKLPGLSLLNRVGGFAVGIFEGLIIVWLGFMVLTLFAATPFGISCLESISDSKFLTFIYDNNLIMRLLGFI